MSTEQKNLDKGLGRKTFTIPEPPTQNNGIASKVKKVMIYIAIMLGLFTIMTLTVSAMVSPLEEALAIREAKQLVVEDAEIKLAEIIAEKEEVENELKGLRLDYHEADIKVAHEELAEYDKRELGTLTPADFAYMEELKIKTNKKEAPQTNQDNKVSFSPQPLEVGVEYEAKESFRQV